MTNTQNNQSIIGYFSLEEVLNIIPVSKSTWWAGIKTGRYPPAHKLSARRVGWRKIDIHDLIQEIDSSQ